MAVRSLVLESGLESGVKECSKEEAIASIDKMMTSISSKESLRVT